MILGKIHTESTLDAAVKTIGEYLTHNDLKVGDHLPTELEMSRQLGISRTILREALRHYRTLGIISSRPKVGMVVKRMMPEDPYKGYLPFISATPGALEEVAELRRCLESGAAELICSRAIEEDFEELRKVSAKMAQTKQPELDTLDTEFHSRLLTIPGNRMIKSLIPLLVKFFQLQAMNQNAEGGERIADEHLALVDAMEKRDPEEFRELIVRHISVERLPDHNMN